MNISLRGLALPLLIVTSGCASAGAALPAPTPEQIPSLERRFAEDPGDVEAGLLLAAGYREAGRPDQARDLVARLTEVAPDDPGLMVMDGLLDEDAGDWAGAVEAYGRFLTTETRGPLRAEVEGRLELARIEALRSDVRNALAREQALAQTDPDPATVGIFPFVFESADAEYEALAVALPELLATDLGITGRLTIVERAKMRALINELQLAESGRVETETAARSGRLLGSGHIVQGRLRMGQGTRVDVDAALVAVGRQGQELADPLAAGNEIERFFELEKQLAFAIYDELGVQLTDAERALVDERHTRSIEALLEFGRGLAASDAGDFGQASQHFAAAEALDPSFALAASHRRRAAAISIAPGAAPAAGQLARQAHRLASMQGAVRQLTNAPASIRQRVLSRLGAEQRSILAEVLGQDRLGQVVLLELVFQGPGGEE